MYLTVIFFSCMFVFSKAIGATNDTVYSKPIKSECPLQCFKVIKADKSVLCDCCGAKENGTPFYNPCSMARCMGCIDAMCQNEAECGNSIIALCGADCKSDASPCQEGSTEVFYDGCSRCVRNWQSQGNNMCKHPIVCPFGCFSYLGRDGCKACRCCNGCVKKNCEVGYECVLREVFCKKPPCPPQESCEKIPKTG